MSSFDQEAREFVQENREWLSEVLRYSQSSYARACAFVLLKHGGSERDVSAIEEDLSMLRDEIE